jgi:histidinol-phosphatase
VTAPAFSEELAFARELAATAAAIAAASDIPALAVRHKHDATPVTDADVAIERALRGAVAARFPLDGFLGEEEGASPGGPRTWVVDPIDGTRNLIDGIQLWTTLIALIEHDRPVLGLAHAPAIGERYEAVAGRGATLNGRPIAVSTVASVEQSLLLHSGVEEWMRGPVWDGFCSLVGSARRTRGISDAWGHMLVARGSADLLLEHEPCGLWDWAAVQVIVGEAGGRLTTLDGAEPFDGCTLLSSNGLVHDEVIDRLGSPAGVRPAAMGDRAALAATLRRPFEGGAAP